MLSWRSLSEESSRFLGPLLLIGALIVCAGALARWMQLPSSLVALSQSAVGAMATSLAVTGDPLPLGPDWSDLRSAFLAAFESANQHAAPIPSNASSIDPVLIASGTACFLTVEILVATLRRTSLAGFTVLAVYCAPLAFVTGGLSWWVFVLTVVGFLAMLRLHEADQLRSWARPDGNADPSGFNVRFGRHGSTASAIGGIATVLSLGVPLVTPSSSMGLVDLDFGGGSGTGADIILANPMVDLKRDLVRGEDTPVLRLVTDDPDPSYLRTSVLTSFNGETWTAGERSVPTSNRADGMLPPVPGLDAGVTRSTFQYEMTVYDNFDSTWLPTMATSTRVEAAGDWRYDEATRDFVAAEPGLDTAGLAYRFTAIEPQYNAEDMAASSATDGLVSRGLTDLPAGLPSALRNLALETTREAPTRYDKAVALQRWFRETGGFEYSLSRQPGTGAGDLVSFLRDRTGYCEQYAATMALMSRTLDIPARVAVGFLGPQRVRAQTWEYSTHDLHAWPELYFSGSGWVRFEPTPAGRVQRAPSWTLREAPVPDRTPDVPATNGPSADTPTRGTNDLTTGDEAAGALTTAGDAGSGRIVSPAVAAATALLICLLAGPRMIRARRRARRLNAGPELAWAELRDTALDLGLAWPDHRTPRHTRDWLVSRCSPIGDVTEEERPPREVGMAAEPLNALDRVVRSLEVCRYARSASPASDILEADVESVRSAMLVIAARRLRWRAAWLPASLLTRRSRLDSATQQTDGDAPAGEHPGFDLAPTTLAGASQAVLPQVQAGHTPTTAIR